MKSKQNWLTRLVSKLERLRCFTSIEDLPVLVWFKIHETNNSKLLYKGFQGLFFNTNKIWGQIYDEYIKRIGLNQEYLNYIDATMQIAKLEIQCIEDQSPINKINLTMARERLKEKETRRRLEYGEIIATVSKNTGFSVYKVSVWEFYSFLKIQQKNAG